MERTQNETLAKEPSDLPFELLGLIFAYYAHDETLIHPLETLLLVSRWWKFVALGHHNIWGNLRIHFGHRPTQEAWLRLLPWRLGRSGTAPLSIELRYALDGLDHPYYERTSTCAWARQYFKGLDTCSCIESAPKFARDLLDILAGPNGEECKRWTKLHITLGGEYRCEVGYGYRTASSWLMPRPFTYPMPSLESLYLSQLQIPHSNSVSPFSFTPSIRTVYIEHCTLGSLDGADFSSAESIIIRSSRILREAPNIFNFRQDSAIKVLDIDIPELRSSMISRALPHLHTLRLGWGDTSQLVDNAEYPSLRNLEFIVSEPSNHLSQLLGPLVSSVHRPLSGITNLTISLDSLSQVLFNRLKDELEPVLNELESIQRIVAPKEILGIILKHIHIGSEQPEVNRLWSNLSGRTLELVSSTTGARAQLTFDKQMHPESIVAAAATIIVPDPALSWDEYVRAFHLSVRYMEI